jgi:hypothetical protein
MLLLDAADITVDANIASELRLKIYEFAFAGPLQTIRLERLGYTWQSWAYEPSQSLGDCTFYPHGLKRIPPALQDEALAIAYQKTIFKATQMDRIVSLYGSLGQVGIENLQTLHLDWVMTHDPAFAQPEALAHNDSLALQAISLLRYLTKLRHLSIQLNGYAFTYAYVSDRHRRLKDLPSDFTERVQLSGAIRDFHTAQGTMIGANSISLGSVLAITEEMALWKVTNVRFVCCLWLEIAQCDPIFEALATIRGLKSFELKQAPKLPSGLDPRIEEWLKGEVTKSRVEEEEALPESC